MLQIVENYSVRKTRLSHFWGSAMLVLVLLMAGLLAGCRGGAGAGSDATGPETSGEVESTAAEGTDSSGENPDEDTDESAEASSGAGASSSVAVTSIENAESIQSYRMRFLLNGLEGEQVSVEGEFVKEPAAQRLLVDMPGSTPESVETLVVDGTRYTRARNRWIQTPGDRFNLVDFAPLTPDLVTGDLDSVTELGTETVNGRTATHYQVNADALPPIPFRRNGEQQDLSTLGSVQLDLWVDTEERFVVKMQATVENEAAETPVQMVYEYYDFNQPFVIEAPS